MENMQGPVDNKTNRVQRANTGSILARKLISFSFAPLVAQVPIQIRLLLRCQPWFALRLPLQRLALVFLGALIVRYAKIILLVDLVAGAILNFRDC